MVHKEFDLAREKPENRDRVKQFALDQAENILINAGVAWPISTPRIEVKSPFKQVLADYREKPHTPELVGAFHSRFWEDKALKAGIELVVEPFKGKQEDLAEHEKKGDMVIYIPEVVAKNRSLLEYLFPDYKGHDALKDGNPFIDNAFHTGYQYTEASIDAPFIKTNEDQLRKKLQDRGRDGMNIAEYFIAGQVSKIVSGKYLDEDTAWVRLLNSSRDGGVVRAGFFPDGRFGVHSYLVPQYQYDLLGGRSVTGVK